MSFVYPLSFESLERYALARMCKISVPPLKRTHSIQMLYDEHRRRHPNMHRYIMDTYLQGQKYCIARNAFPYNVAHNVIHYVLWLAKEDDVVNKDNILVHLQTRFPNKPFVWFENVPERKSVPSILHYHIFVKQTSSHL